MKHLIYKGTISRKSTFTSGWIWECGHLVCNVYNVAKSQKKALRSLEQHVRRFHV